MPQGLVPPPLLFNSAMHPFQPASSPANAPGPRASRRVRLQCAGTGLLVAVALADLLRWFAYPDSWPRFHTLMPMTPVLSGMLTLLGAALGLRLLFPGGLA